MRTRIFYGSMFVLCLMTTLDAWFPGAYVNDATWWIVYGCASWTACLMALWLALRKQRSIENVSSVAQGRSANSTPHKRNS